MLLATACVFHAAQRLELLLLVVTYMYEPRSCVRLHGGPFGPFRLLHLKKTNKPKKKKETADGKKSLSTILQQNGRNLLRPLGVGLFGCGTQLFQLGGQGSSLTRLAMLSANDKTILI